MFQRHVLPFLVWLIYRLWIATWRIKLEESEGMKALLKNGGPIVFAHWHGDELLIIPTIPHYKIAAITSTSKDGELMNSVIKRLGAVTSRGSSTRGGTSALKGIIRLVKLGFRGAVAVDGPKGPLHQVKPGVFELSRLAQAQIIPLGAASSRSITFKKSWNKAKLPLPFAKVVIHFNQPWPVIEKGFDLESKSRQLAFDISDATHHAAKHFAQA